MKWLGTIVTTCALTLAGMSAYAMPIGIRTLLHAHAVARQLSDMPPPEVWTVTFDVQGGTFGGMETDHSIDVTNGCAIGSLPSVSRADHLFLGWFTSVDGGDKASAEMLITSDVTLYAHWQCRFAFGEGGIWLQQADDSWKSCDTPDGVTNSLSMMVNGPGTVSFRWKASCEDYFNFKGMLLRQDGLAFFVDGMEQAFTNGIMSGWSECSFVIETMGTHVFTWSYIKDASGQDGEDCAWVDKVTWTQAGVSVDMGEGKMVFMPLAWFDSHPALLAVAGGDAAAALQAMAANGRMSVAECYVVGVDPEKADEGFKITSFPMKADGTPDLANLEFAPAQSEWNVPGAQPVIKGAATLGGEWQTVTDENKAGFRFFKVVVELP